MNQLIFFQGQNDSINNAVQSTRDAWTKEEEEMVIYYTGTTSFTVKCYYNINVILHESINMRLSNLTIGILSLNHVYAFVLYTKREILLFMKVIICSL